MKAQGTSRIIQFDEKTEKFVEQEDLESSQMNDKQMILDSLYYQQSFDEHDQPDYLNRGKGKY